MGQRLEHACARSRRDQAALGDEQDSVAIVNETDAKRRGDVAELEDGSSPNNAERDGTWLGMWVMWMSQVYILLSVCQGWQKFMIHYCRIMQGIQSHTR